MGRPKIAVTGLLRYSETEGIQFSLTLVREKRGEKHEDTVWLEALENAMSWPGVEKTEDREAYLRSLHANSHYKEAARAFLEQQRKEPQLLLGDLLWAYKDQVVKVESQPEVLRDKTKTVLLVRHHVLREQREYDRIRREVDALENLEKLERVSREPIPDHVRLFVWQRDDGRCVKCGSRERLEFDHIIAITLGGSNTERNIQLLCESCNRSKGATI